MKHKINLCIFEEVQSNQSSPALLERIPGRPSGSGVPAMFMGQLPESLFQTARLCAASPFDQLHSFYIHQCVAPQTSHMGCHMHVATVKTALLAWKVEHIFDTVTLQSQCVAHGESVLIYSVLRVNFIYLTDWNKVTVGANAEFSVSRQFLTKAVVESRPQYPAVLTSGSTV